MKFVSAIFTFGALSLIPISSWAQLDSSYELLLGNHAPGLSSTVNPKDSRTTKALKKQRTPASEATTTNVEAVAEATAAATTVVKTEASPKPVAVETAEPSLAQQAQSLFSAQPEKVLGFYQEHFSEEDPRQNQIEISFAPSYVINESSSNYSFRDYRSVFTGVNIGANVWLTPALGVGGDFLFSLGADTSGDAVTGVRSQAHYEYLNLGLKFRQFFGFSENSKSLEFEVLYSDRKFNVNADDLYRAKLKTSGVGLQMNLRVPSSKDVSWVVGGSIFPRLQHSETGTGTEIGSGNNTENVRIGFLLGSEVRLSRAAQIFYQASLSSEKNVFDGNAKIADPSTGLVPKNVSVTDSLYMFSIGYRWGN